MKYTVGISIPAQKKDGTKITLKVGDIIDVSGKSVNGGNYLAKDSSGNDIQFPIKFWGHITPTTPTGGGAQPAPSPYHSGKPPVAEKEDSASLKWYEKISTTTKILSVIGLAGGIAGGAYYVKKNPESKKWIAYVGFGTLGTAVGFGVGAGYESFKK